MTHLEKLNDFEKQMKYIKKFIKLEKENLKNGFTDHVLDVKLLNLKLEITKYVNDSY